VIRGAFDVTFCRRIKDIVLAEVAFESTEDLFLNTVAIPEWLLLDLYTGSSDIRPCERFLWTRDEKNVLFISLRQAGAKSDSTVCV
jgi:hypothetical protein